jgi:hypothetical protein
MVTKSKLLFRILRYLWVGYVSYLAVPLSLVTTLVAIYYLAIDSIPAFKSVFSHFWFFLVAALALGIPITSIIGWLHVKYNPTPHSSPGYWQEAVAPLYIELLRGIEKILDKDDMLDKDDKKRMREIEARLQALIDSRKTG